MKVKCRTVRKAEWLYHIKAFPGGASQWNVTAPGKKKRTVNRQKDLALRRSQMTSEKAGDGWRLQCLLSVEVGEEERLKTGAGDTGSRWCFRIEEKNCEWRGRQ